MTVRFTVTNHTIVRVLLIVLAFGLAINLIVLTRNTLTLIGVAFFLSLALSPPVNYLANRMPRGSRGLATGAAYLVILSLLGLLVYAIAPPLISQTSNFIDNIPSYIDQLETGDNFIARQAREFDVIDSLRQSQDEITSQIRQAGGPLLDIIQRITSSIASVIAVLVLTFFMLVEGPTWIDRFFAVQPKNKRKHNRELAEKMYRVVTGYVNGQLLIAVIGAITTLAMLFVLDIPYAVPLAVIVGVFALIPLIGATLGAVIVVTAALFKSVTVALILLVFYVVYQQFENSVIQPMVQARSVDLSPLVILMSAMLGVTIAGLLGALVAIPLAGCLRVLLDDYLEHKDITSKDPEY